MDRSVSGVIDLYVGDVDMQYDTDAPREHGCPRRADSSSPDGRHLTRDPSSYCVSAAISASPSRAPSLSDRRCFSRAQPHGRNGHGALTRFWISENDIVMHKRDRGERDECVFVVTDNAASSRIRLLQKPSDGCPWPPKLADAIRGSEYVYSALPSLSASGRMTVALYVTPFAPLRRIRCFLSVSHSRLRGRGRFRRCRFRSRRGSGRRCGRRQFGGGRGACRRAAVAGARDGDKRRGFVRAHCLQKLSGVAGAEAQR